MFSFAAAIEQKWKNAGSGSKVCNSIASPHPCKVSQEHCIHAVPKSFFLLQNLQPGQLKIFYFFTRKGLELL